MQIYREILPNSYLLILVETAAMPTDASLLRDALRRAGRSGKDSVWIDCSDVRRLDPALLSVLGCYGAWLLRRHIPLILCHPPTTLTADTLQTAHAESVVVVNTLLDAELHQSIPETAVQWSTTLSTL